MSGNVYVRKIFWKFWAASPPYMYFDNWTLDFGLWTWLLLWCIVQHAGSTISTVCKSRGKSHKDWQWGNKKTQKKLKTRPCNKKDTSRIHTETLHKTEAQSHERKWSSPMKSTRRKEREIPRRKEAQKGLGVPTYFRGAVPLFCSVFLYEFGRCPFCCKAALCVSFGSSFCPITPPCGFYPCFYFIEGYRARRP